MRRGVKKIAGLFAFFVICIYMPEPYAQVDPQVGEGCNQLLVKVGTELDDVAGEVTVVDAKIDTLQTDMGEVLTQLTVILDNIFITNGLLQTEVIPFLNDIRVDDFGGTFTMVQEVADCCLTVSGAVFQLQDEMGIPTDIGLISLDITSQSVIDHLDLNVIQLLKTILSYVAFPPT